MTVTKYSDPDIFAAAVRSECDALATLLIAKNAAYGNAALDPVRIFSQANPGEQIRVRIDDKLSRLARGSAAGEDVIRDLLGYLILLRLSERGQSEPIHSEPIELPIPVIVGEPRVEHARCSTCSAEATATIEFVGTHATEAGEPRGVWAPAIYTCPAGHFTLESET